MLPLGYMAKRIVTRPQWLKADRVEEILSLSSCSSEDFADWINFWRHNGYWLFDSPPVIQELAREHGLDLSDCRWFYYEGHETAYDDDARDWLPYSPDSSFATSVLPPNDTVLRGYDIVTHSCGNLAECSPLSCNHMAEKIVTNRHCLLDSFEEAYQLTDERRFVDCEPGPYRIVAVYEIPHPSPTEKGEQAATDQPLPAAKFR
ncbi:MAG: hypothetical protein CFE26_10435 [Verrucomicrobiales bacterium VVV1]|nr:MAG: hypothetical protein CFE26_10435 [Verrucomicrobiales bacterium VVV1]